MHNLDNLQYTIQIIKLSQSIAAIRSFIDYLLANCSIDFRPPPPSLLGAQSQ